jgi:hypothetical protein
MPRSERQVPAVYFGRPGAFISLPWPRGDLDKPFTRQVYDFLTGSGSHFISKSPDGARTGVVNWNALHLDNFNLIDQFWTGANGSGPWAFIDPSVPNLLLPNQASATATTYDTTGFATSTGATNMGTLLSNTSPSFIRRAGSPRSLRWQFTVGAAASPQLNLASPYRNWYGIPAVPGLPYTFSVWGRPDSIVDTAITLSAQMLWTDAAGATLSTATSGNINMNSGYVKLTATGTAPANTAYIQPVLVADGATITTGASIYLDEMMLEQDSVANTWAPGNGCRAVEITSLADIVPFESRMRRNCTMVYQELVA